MIDVHAALRERYLAPLKEQPELYIGVELEFPIVNLRGQATDIELSKALMSYLLTQGFELVRTDQEGQPIEVKQVTRGDVILFELSYNTLEVAFAKTRTIGEVAERLEAYLDLIQPFLRQADHELQGCGLHPHWQLNDNRPVALPRYQMLGAYLALGANEQSCHPFADYGAFICGNQVQFDLSRANYLRTINAFNQIEAAKAYLFPNSAFEGHSWDTKIARDYFWEESMHGLIKENVGVYPRTFTSEQDYLDYMSQSALFTVQRQERTYYFSPRSLTAYFAEKSVSAQDLAGQKHVLHPQLGDMAYHRSYHYQVLTTRGTVELRSVCTQPLDRTFAPIAFQLGLLINLDALEAYLGQAPFFVSQGRDYPALRRRFSKSKLSQEEQQDIQQFSQDLLDLARQGLLARQQGEETYLSPLV